MWTFRTPIINAIESVARSNELGGILLTVSTLVLVKKIGILRKYVVQTETIFKPYEGIITGPTLKKSKGTYSRNWFILAEKHDNIAAQILQGKLAVKEIIHEQSPLSEWLNFKLYLQ
jgi:hypothetical protein